MTQKFTFFLTIYGNLNDFSPPLTQESVYGTHISVYSIQILVYPTPISV